MPGPLLQLDRAKELFISRYEHGKYESLQPQDIGKKLGTEQDDWDEAFADVTLEQIEPLLDIFEDKNIGNSDDRARRFDQQVCSVIHKELSLDNHPDLIPNDNFWRYLALIKFDKVIAKRRKLGDVVKVGDVNIRRSDTWKRFHEAPSEGAVGLTSITNNQLYSWWARADILYDKSNTDNPYHIAQIDMSQDEYDSGVLRHRYAFSRIFAQTLVQWQRPRGGADGPHLSAPNKKRNNNQGGMRDLIKRLQQEHAQISYGVLTEEDIRDLLRRLSKDLEHDMNSSQCPCQA